MYLIKDGTITLSGYMFPHGLDQYIYYKYSYRLQFGLLADFMIELFPVHSPLLRESLLVSFPPLSYMLKFSGSSCVTETQEMSVSSYGDGVPRLE